VQTAQIDGDPIAVLDGYASAWTQGAPQRVAGPWHANGDQLTYIAEELGEILTDHDRIAQRPPAGQTPFGEFLSDISECAGAGAGLSPRAGQVHL